jgi:hypothetical protein
MGDIDITLEQLQAMVGTELRYQGIACTLVEVLTEPPVLVLRPIGAAPVIQAYTSVSGASSRRSNASSSSGDRLSSRASANRPMIRSASLNPRRQARKVSRY